MNSEEQTLIDGLFTRLQEAERQTAPRDAQAEAQINQHLVRQPAAPYYMAQAMLIQEAAIKRLDQRVKELEAQVASLQQNRPSSGGFLAGLFGGGQAQNLLDGQRQRLMGQIGEDLNNTLLYVYRDLSDAELEEFATFAESPDGKAYYQAALAAVRAGLAVGQSSSDLK